MSFWAVVMAVCGFFLLVGGAWAVVHPERVDASFSRGLDSLSLPPWTRRVFGVSNMVIGAALVIASMFFR
jgi:hypothetical protein